MPGGDREHEVERGNDIDSLCADTKSGDPVEFAGIDEAPSKPPLIPIEEQAIAVDARLGRFCRPAGGQHAPAIPPAVGQHELAELRHVAGAEPQAAIGAELAADTDTGPIEVSGVDR